MGADKGRRWLTTAGRSDALEKIMEEKEKLMKTPDEIKIWLATEIAVHYHLPNPEPRLTPKEFMFLEKMNGETLAYIERLEADNESKQKRIDELESRLAQAEMERDAAVEDLYPSCELCKYDNRKADEVPYIGCGHGMNWEWRGVCPENTKEK